MTYLLKKYHYALVTILVTLTGIGQVYANACPDNTMPRQVKALYIKYAITDGLVKRKGQEENEPLNIAGDTVREIILWKGYSWERLSGQYEDIDREHKKLHDAEIESAIRSIEARQNAGQEVPLEEIENTGKRMLNYIPKRKMYDYNRTTVRAPKYTLHYNTVNRQGYGYYTINLTEKDRKRMDKKVLQKTDLWIKNGVSKLKDAFGLEKVSSRQSKILGYDCQHEIMKTGVSDFRRDYDQIESCQAKIDGHTVELLKKIGKSGEKYIKQAVHINRAYNVNREKFCSPDFITVKK